MGRVERLGSRPIDAANLLIAHDDGGEADQERADEQQQHQCGNEGDALLAIQPHRAPHLYRST
jgi:hypothetical protein